jgi:predicted protein tyrosine phosphatase
LTSKTRKTDNPPAAHQVQYSRVSPAADLGWADVIFVMEKNHKNRIAKKFCSAMAGKKIVCLFIEDIHELVEDALIAELRLKLAPHLSLPEP